MPVGVNQKRIFDAINARLSLSGGTLTGDLTLEAGATFRALAWRGPNISIVQTSPPITPIEYPIYAANSDGDYFTIEGDHAAEFAPGQTITVTGTNAGTYTIIEVGGSDTYTNIGVDEDIPSDTADGTLISAAPLEANDALGALTFDHDHDNDVSRPIANLWTSGELQLQGRDGVDLVAGNYSLQLQTRDLALSGVLWTAPYFSLNCDTHFSFAALARDEYGASVGHFDFIGTLRPTAIDSPNNNGVIVKDRLKPQADIEMDQGTAIVATLIQSGYADDPSNPNAQFSQIHLRDYINLVSATHAGLMLDAGDTKLWGGNGTEITLNIAGNGDVNVSATRQINLGAPVAMTYINNSPPPDMRNQNLSFYINETTNVIWAVAKFSNGDVKTIAIGSLT